MAVKPNNTCLKCASSNLIPVPVLPGDGPHIAIGDRLMHEISVRQLVCGECGFVETWMAGDDDLSKLREQYGRSK